MLSERSLWRRDLASLSAKKLSRGNKLDKNSYIQFVKTLEISNSSKSKLLDLTPSKYIGLSKKL